VRRCWKARAQNRQGCTTIGLVFFLIEINGIWGKFIYKRFTVMKTSLVLTFPLNYSNTFLQDWGPIIYVYVVAVALGFTTLNCFTSVLFLPFGFAL